tara:strand:+ start:388 stop:531 length:144 start_codon:yes stop_codon:yes gene_type:complete
MFKTGFDSTEDPAATLVFAPISTIALRDVEVELASVESDEISRNAFA